MTGKDGPNKNTCKTGKKINRETANQAARKLFAIIVFAVMLSTVVILGSKGLIVGLGAKGSLAATEAAVITDSTAGLNTLTTATSPLLHSASNAIKNGTKIVSIDFKRFGGSTTSISTATTTSATTTISSGGSGSFGFSIYTNVSSLLQQFKTYYSGSNSGDMLIDDVYSNPPRTYLNYYNHPQTFSRMILNNNYSELTSTVLSPYVNDIPLARAYNFTSKDYVGYDIEDWALTPLSEKQSYASYTQKACNFVHAAGYEFAFTPEVDVPGWGQFAQVNWTCVDFLDLQEQFLSASTASLTRNVTQLLSASKAKNPNMVVFVQLDMQAASQSVLESDILAMSKLSGVNGIIIQDLCSTSSCSNELTTLVDYINSIQPQGSTSTVVTTTSTFISTSTVPTTTAVSTSTTTATTTTAPIFLPPGKSPVIMLPINVQASSAIGSVVVNVKGTGFTPDTLVNFGYAPIPPYSSAIIAPISDANGNWTGKFTAPWIAGTYTMVAVDANGVRATGSLIVTT